MSSVNICEFDRDCPANEICFRNVSWRGDGCGCNTFYGFKRNPVTLQCSDLDKAATFMITYSSIVMVIIGFVLLISITDAFKLYRSKSVSGVLVSTCVFNIFCMVSNFFDYLLLILNDFAPIYEPVNYSDATDTKSTKVAKYSPPERVLLILAGLFMVFAALNMFVLVTFTYFLFVCIEQLILLTYTHSPLYWLEVAQRSKRLQQHVISNIKRYKTPLIVFQIVFALFMIIVGVILGYFSIVCIVIIPIIFGVIYIYIYLLVTLKSLFVSPLKDENASISKTNLKGSRIIKEFKITARIILFGLVVCGIFIAQYGLLNILYGEKEISRENSVHTFIISVVLYRTGFLICNIGLAQYIHKRVSIMLEKSSFVVVAVNDHSNDPSKTHLSSKEFVVGIPSSRLPQEICS